MKKDKNEVEKVKKESPEAGFLKSKKQSIIDSFNETIEQGKSIWELPVISIRFMNISSGTIYGPSNATYLDSQLKQKKRALLITEYRKSPLLNAIIEDIIAENDLSKSLNINNILVSIGEKDDKVKKELALAYENISKKETGPYFLTWNQGKNIYDFKGSNKFYVIHKFVEELKRKKDDKEENKEENNDVEQNMEEENKEEGKKISSIFKKRTKITDLHNYSQLKILPDLNEPAAYKRRMEAFEKPVEDNEVDTLIKAMEKISLYPVTRDVGEDSGSFFSRQIGVINIPPTNYFKSSIEELHTLSHEMAHSFGFAADQKIEGYKRFHRECYSKYHESNRMRAEEELVANVSAGALLNHFNIKSTSEQRQKAFEHNNDVYDIGWATELKNNPDSVVNAVDMAEKIVSHMAFLIKKELKLMYEKDPTIPLPALVKEEIISLKKKEDLDPDIANDYSPTFIDNRRENKIRKPEPYRRGR